MIKNLWFKYKELFFYGVFGVGATVINIVSYRVLANTFGKKYFLIANIIAWILAFIFVETALLMVVPAELIIGMVSKNYVWLMIIGGFWLASMLAEKWTMASSRAMQYAGNFMNQLYINAKVVDSRYLFF